MKNLIEVYVKNVIVVKNEEGDTSFLVLLAEKEGNRVLPISIGMFEAQAIARALEGVDIGRPLTHDLIVNIIRELGATLDKVVVNDLIDGTFYARLIVKTESKLHSIDARPSDSIAVAILAKAPIFVSSKVMDEAGEVLPEDSEGGEDFKA